MILDQQFQIMFCSAPYMLDKKKTYSYCLDFWNFRCDLNM